MDKMAYKTFVFKISNISNEVDPNFGETVDVSLNKYGEQGYVVDEMYVDNDYLFVFMSKLIIEPKAPKRAKKRVRSRPPDSSW